MSSDLGSMSGYTKQDKLQRDIRHEGYLNYIQNVNAIIYPDNQEGVFKRRTSIGSEAFYRLNLYWYLTLPLYRRSDKRFGQNNHPSMNAETSLPSLPSLKNAVNVSNVPYKLLTLHKLLTLLCKLLTLSKIRTRKLASFFFEFIIQWYASSL